MNFFQIIVPVLIVIVFIMISRSRAMVVERLFYIFVTIGGLFFIIFPEDASHIANWMGIGRGADLIFYIFILFAWFWFTSTSSKLRHNDRKITNLVRIVAITHPLKEVQENHSQKLGGSQVFKNS